MYRNCELSIDSEKVLQVAVSLCKEFSNENIYPSHVLKALMKNEMIMFFEQTSKR